MLMKNPQIAMRVKAKNLRGPSTFNRFFRSFPHDGCQFIGVELEVVGGNSGVFADQNHFNLARCSLDRGMRVEILALPPRRGQARRLRPRALGAEYSSFMGIELGQCVG